MGAEAEIALPISAISASTAVKIFSVRGIGYGYRAPLLRAPALGTVQLSRLSPFNPPPFSPTLTLPYSVCSVSLFRPL